MAQTLVSLMVHVVFSTRNREPLVTPAIETELFAYVGGHSEEQRITLTRRRRNR
jgi:hypothetical protein